MDDKKMPPFSHRELEEENVLLIAQLHSVQAELERVEKQHGHPRGGKSGGERTCDGCPSLTGTVSTVSKGKKNVFLNKFSRSSKAQKRIELIRNSGAFDARWYLQAYPDVAEKEMDPVEHYCKFGSKEHRDPSPYFDTSWYLEQYPDVAKIGINPLYHYLRFGRDECRKPAQSREPGCDISIHACLVDDLRKESAFQRARAEDSEKETSALLRECQEWKTIADEREQEKAQIKARYVAENEALIQQLQENRARLEDSQEYVRGLMQKYELLERKTRSDEEALITATSEQQELEQQLFSLQKELVEVLETSDHHRALSETWRDELEQLRGLSKDHETREAALVEKCSMLEAREETREQEIASLKQLHAELKSQYQLFRDQLKASAEKVREGQERIKVLEQENQRHQAEVESGKQALSSAETERVLLEEQFSDQKQKLIEAQNDLVEQKSSVESLKTKLMQLQNAQSQLESEKEKAEVRAQTAEAALANAERERHRLEAQLISLQRELEAGKQSASEESQQALQQFAEIKQWLINEANS